MSSTRGQLFGDDNDYSSHVKSPLADRMRPSTFDTFVGQLEVLGPGAPLRQAIESDNLQSIILWGPPGTGKTTVAHLIATVTQSHFISFSAVLSGIKEIKTVMAEAVDKRKRLGRSTILFVDEIHRFNKSQQDAFLPRVETGDINLIGATTENPSFEVNSALLSRSKVFLLKPLTLEEIVTILKRALSDSDLGLGQTELTADDQALISIAQHANGDARVALNTLEFASTMAASKISSNTAKHSRNEVIKAPKVIDQNLLKKLFQKKTLIYDKNGEEHFNLISALHKSMRNSDPDATVYWLARMLEAGENPLYIARRLIRFASEDIGNADPRALMLAVAAKEAVHFVGMPEGNTALTQAALYLSIAPKSNAIYRAYNRAAEDADKASAEPVPLHLRNAPTTLMKELDYHKGYQYAHNDEDGVTDMSCLPENLSHRNYYQPTQRGLEKAIGEKLKELNTLRKTKLIKRTKRDA